MINKTSEIQEGVDNTAPVADAIKIMHITSGLGVGGAEAILIDVLKHSDNQKICNYVVCLGSPAERFDINSFEMSQITYLGIEKSILSLLSGFRALRNLLREHQPNLVHTWMYHADLIGGIAAYTLGYKVIWGIFSGNLEKKFYKSRTRLVIRICTILSRVIPDRIISCSQRGIRTHADVGYPASKMTFVPIGFDVERYRCDSDKRKEFRGAYNISEQTFVVGMAARFDPQKDYETLLSAMSKVRNEICQVELIVVGGYGISTKDSGISRLIDKYDLGNITKILGYVSSIESYYNGLDLFVLTSHGEGFPRVLGEAMASGTPCIGTNVGDISEIIGDTGFLVDRNDPENLARLIVKFHLLSPEEKFQYSQKARERIRTMYSIDRMIKEYCQEYSSICGQRLSV